MVEKPTLFPSFSPLRLAALICAGDLLHIFSHPMSIIKFSIVAAMNSLRGIGVQGALPWRLSGDMKFFKTLTMQTTVYLQVENDV